MGVSRTTDIGPRPAPILANFAFRTLATQPRCPGSYSWRQSAAQRLSEITKHQSEIFVYPCFASDVGIAAAAAAGVDLAGTALAGAEPRGTYDRGACIATPSTCTSRSISSVSNPLSQFRFRNSSPMAETRLSWIATPRYIATPRPCNSP
ncbi:hypothetical protein K505DRAFT_76077 [Melanomma pulvis-pyrius CBS 109.77]|uniref:Uncharacterized protein n=1 Tax=Melanomma pulvis-pyrius CBS 109.77 TaxID=1314802 RepID=A0A6A6XS10_9PLEO|nr:hypothetical protein K505DRAFT_76077 [Melanomma pulvis-pyrius CBS 109.77]